MSSSDIANEITKDMDIQEIWKFTVTGCNKL